MCIRHVIPGLVYNVVAPYCPSRGETQASNNMDRSASSLLSFETRLRRVAQRHRSAIVLLKLDCRHVQINSRS